MFSPESNRSMPWNGNYRAALLIQQSEGRESVILTIALMPSTDDSTKKDR